MNRIVHSRIKRLPYAVPRVLVESSLIKSRRTVDEKQNEQLVKVDNVREKTMN